MKTALFVFVFIVGCSAAWAEEDYSAMRDFIKQEDERLKEIKLLTLDLEKADLEFKKKEIESKMSGLVGGPSPAQGIVSTKTADGLPDVQVSGVMINNTSKAAFINVDQKLFIVREGQEFGNGIKAVKITDQLVSVQYADGKIHSLKVED